jgi:hypothetical protein
LIGPHLGVAVTFVATAWTLGRAARALFGPAGFAPTVVAYALLRSFGEAKAGAANTEAFLQLPLVGAGWLLLAEGRRPRTAALAGGALLAVAALLKAPAAAYGAAAVVAVFALRGRDAAWTTAWCGLVGAAAIGALEGLRVLLHGDAQGWWVCNVAANRVYMEHGPAHGAGDLLTGLWDEIARVPAPWILAAIGAASPLVTWLPSPFDGDPGPPRRLLTAAAVLLATGLALVTLGGHFFRHYWLMVHPVLALLVAGGVVSLTRAPVAWWRVGLCVVVVAVGWLPAQRTAKRRRARSRAGNPYPAPAVATGARAIRAVTTPEDTLVGWGGAPGL